MIFLVLLVALCTITNFFAEVMLLIPLEVLRSIHLPGIVLWGSLLFLFAWVMGD